MQIFLILFKVLRINIGRNKRKMEIQDFLPKYPNIEKFNEDILNPYDDGFYSSIYKKKEFYDERLSPTEDLPNEKGTQMKHQKIISRFLSSHTMYDSLLLVHEMGCVDPSTPVLLWNGLVKRADEVNVGDKLIGDDGLPREVMSLINGESEMFKIDQVNGDSYVVNKDHILTLYITGNMRIEWTEATKTWVLSWFDKKELVPKVKTKYCRDISFRKDGYQFLCDFRDTIDNDDDTIDIKVSDYLKLPVFVQSCMKGYKCEGVKWSKKHVDLDPYLLGMWLGNENSSGACFVGDNEELINYWKSWAVNNDSCIGRVGSSKFDYYIKPNSGEVSRLKSKLRQYGLINNKHIPIEYSMNDRETRLKLLAGIIDTNGHVYNKGTYVSINEQNDVLANQICYLVRSLGFSCQQTICVGSGVKNVSKILTITGRNLEEIPVLLEKNKLHTENQLNNPLLTNISVTSVGFGKYVGWTIGDNRRFLLGDFTVTHNTGKTCSAIGAIEQIKNEENNFKGALIFAKGSGLLQNFIKELRDKCTAGQYVPEGFVDPTVGGCGEKVKQGGGLTDLEASIRTKKLTQAFYTTGTFETFSKHLHRLKDAEIISLYSNHIIVIDEVHNLRIQDVTEGDRISMYDEFKRFLHLVKNCKIMLLSGTPMKSYFLLPKYDLFLKCPNNFIYFKIYKICTI